MGQSNILGEEENLQPTPPGHGISDLGPSDTSDSGSDIAGAPGTANDAGLAGGDPGTTSDIDRAVDAGPDLGDANLDSDSDSVGTGERMAAGRDSSASAGADIAPDRITEDPGGMNFGDDPEGVGVSSDSDKGKSGKPR